MMNVRALSRLSCKLWSHGRCGCEPVTVFSSNFCTESKLSSRASPQNRSVITIPSARFSTGKEDSPSKQPEQAKSYQTKLKGLWKAYGTLAIGTYLSIYATTLGSIFFALDLNLLNSTSFGVDPIEAVKKVCDMFESVTGNTSLPGYIRENPRVGTFAVAWLMCKFTEPIRLAVTLGTVPTIARWVGKEKKDKDIPEK
eukprot:gene4274-4694_t